MYVCKHMCTSIMGLGALTPSSVLYHATCNVSSGILPDTLHLLYLAVVPDVLVALLCDLSDGAARRDNELESLWTSYKAWCDSQGRVSTPASQTCTRRLILNYIGVLFIICGVLPYNGFYRVQVLFLPLVILGVGY